MNPLDWLDYEVLGNTVLAWLTSAAVLAAVSVALIVVRRVLRRRLLAFAASHSGTALRVAQHVLARTAGWFLLLVALFGASTFLAMPPRIATLIGRALTIGVLVQVGLWTTVALAAFLELRRERQLAEDPGAVAVMDLLGFVLRLAVWAAVLLVMLDNLGVNITALVAGLGVGGVAVALAAQSILGDLFASLSIVFDKPFVVGDFLVIGEFMGTVEHVGLKTTRMRSLSGEQVVFSNTDLLGSRIRNYGRMFERRLVFSIGVTYQTPGPEAAVHSRDPAHGRHGRGADALRPRPLPDVR
jgi:small-conductance mechanosensitive channel